MDAVLSMNLMETNSKSKQKLFFNVLILIIAISSYIRRDYQFHTPSLFETVVVEIVTPIQEKTVRLQRSFGSIIEHYLKNVEASKENILLNERLSQLEEQIFLLDEIALENNRLKELLEFDSITEGRRVLAQVIAWDASSSFRVLRINKGTRHGVRPRATVVTSQGLVGHVYRSTLNYSDVITILDSNNRVDGLISRTRSHGIVEGHSAAKMQMKFVQRTGPVILGDRVVTSGLGNIYPKGIKVGHVSKIERQSYGITQYIEVSPSVDFGRLEEVVILIESEQVALAQKGEKK